MPVCRVLIPLLLLLAPLGAQDSSALDQVAREELSKLNIPGAAVAIVRGNGVVYSKAFGVASVETGEPVRPEMLFRLGSTTKMLTAAALVRLAVEGRIDLNAPIGKYISGLPPKLSLVTPNQLLSHTAGVKDEAPMYGSHDESALGNGIRKWTDAWLFTAPGCIFSYSNPGYWLVGYLVEVVSGMPYADAMDALVFHPVGMSRTTLRPIVAMTYPLAMGHDAVPGSRYRVTRPAADNAASWPAGSVFSQTEDLARFVRVFLNDGLIDGEKALDPKVIALLSSPHSRAPDSTNQYGYGLEVREHRGVRVLEHGGSRSGYGSFIRMLPEERAGIIILVNRTGGNLPATLERASELLAPLKPAPAASAKIAAPLSAADLQRVAGLYRNGDQRMEFVAHDNRLFWKRGTSETELVKHSASRYAPADGGPEFVISGADGKAEYVTSGSRSFARSAQ